MSAPTEDRPRSGALTAAVALLVVAVAALAVPLLFWFMDSRPPGQAATPPLVRTSPAVPSRSGSGVVPSPTAAPVSVLSQPPTEVAPSTPPRPSADDRPPTPVTNLRLVESSPTSVTVAWDPATDNVAVTHYVVLQDGTPAVAATVTTVRLDWLRRGSQMLVQVAALDAAGNQSEWRSLVVVPAPVPTRTSAPPAPSPSSPGPTVTRTVTVTYSPTPVVTPTPTPGASGPASGPASLTPTPSATPSSTP